MDRKEPTKDKADSRSCSIAAAGMLAVAVILGGWSCTSNNSVTTAVKTDPTPQSTVPLETAVTKEVVPVSRDAPPILMDAGEFAENIYDAAKANDWKTAEAKLASLKANAIKISAQKLGSPDLDASLARLDPLIASKDRTNVLIEANRLTLECAELSAKFKLKLPVEVVKLDYYGRELEIWSAAKDEAKLHETAILIRQTWDSLKPKIESKGATKQASVFEALVAKTDAAKTPAQFAPLAKPILDEVDNLEKVFAQ